MTHVVDEYVTLPGGRVHVLRGGSGAPLLFLHATGGAGRWQEFHELLAQRFEVFAPDHPGWGGSDDFPEVEGMDDLVYHYLDVMERLGLDRPHVIGASFGGWLAAELAVHSPHRIGSLVLLSAPGLRLPDHPVADLFLMTVDELVPAVFKDTSKSGVVFPPDPGVDEILAIYRELTALARFSWVPFLNNPKLERRLHRITAPTLVVWPDEDHVVPIEHGRRYAELIPGAEFAVVEDCGHAMYFERPAEFALVTSSFLGAVAELSGASR